MHAATSFYRPTLPAWGNRGPSVRSRAPGDETLRSALVEALDLSQQRLCTAAGHDRLLGLLLGGGAGGAVEALTRALVGAIGHNNDRRVRPLCALAARTLASLGNRWAPQTAPAFVDSNGERRVQATPVA